jgi:hypothetical protein
MRHTFASVAIAAGIPTFEIARMTGTSVLMIEKTYGHLLADALDRGGARGVRQEHGGARRCTVAMKTSSVSIALLLLLVVAVAGCWRGEEARLRPREVQADDRGHWGWPGRSRRFAGSPTAATRARRVGCSSSTTAYRTALRAK